MNEKRRILKNLVSMSVAEFASKGLQFFYTVYLAAILGPVAFGSIGFAKSHIAFYIMAVTLGMDIYGCREVAGDKTNIRKYVNSIITIRVLLSFIAYFVLCIVVFFFLQETLLVKIIFLIAGLSIFSNAILLQWVYQALERMEIIAYRSFFIGLLNFIGIFLLVRKPDDALVAMCVMSGAFLINSLWMIYIYVKEFGPIKPDFDMKSAKNVIKVSFSIGMSIFVIMLYNTLDMNMLGFILGSDSPQKGIYYLAHNLLIMAILPANILQSVFFPMFSQNKTGPKMLEIMKRFSIINFLAGSFISLAIFVFSTEIAALFGEKYVATAELLKYFSLTIFLVYISVNFYSPMLAWGLEKKALVANICGLVINAILISILIPQYGMYGAAVGTIFSEAIVAVVLAYYYRKQTGSMFTGMFLKILGISVLAILPGALFKYYFHLPYIGIGISVVMLVLAGMFFKIFTIKDLKEYIKKR
jgi:O-antigen/teichoic acid export membrane protein